MFFNRIKLNNKCLTFLSGIYASVVTSPMTFCYQIDSKQMVTIFSLFIIKIKYFVEKEMAMPSHPESLKV